jgi:hypothetical protein
MSHAYPESADVIHQARLVRAELRFTVELLNDFVTKLERETQELETHDEETPPDA